MTILGVHLYVVLLAAAAAWIAGGVWYGVLAKPWMAALGKTPEELKPSPGPYILSFLADILIALIIALAMAAISGGHGGVRIGMAVALLLWAGCVLTTISVNNAFAGRPLMLTLIDAGHWLLAMLVAGAVVGAFPLD
jgi:Protein of unknown function (DUF1761)